MAIHMELADPRHPDVRQLLLTGHTEMQALFPAKRQIRFSVEPLLADGVHVIVARAEGRPVGCCALFLGGAFAELKKLYVVPEARRQGAADQLVAHAEAIAKDAGFALLKLETGVTLSVAHRLIRERFLAFNRARGNAAVPTGFLLGFMRQWRTSPDAAEKPRVLAVPKRSSTPEELELHRLIAAAPSKNWQFHASDLCRLIGQAAYEARVLDAVRHFGCPRFAATLAVHSRAVLAGEISR